MTDEPQPQGETVGTGRIDVAPVLKKLLELGSKAAVRDFYRAKRQGLSNDAALACARGTQRARIR